jgi:E3 ubiquitin-protein ligase UBR4
MLTSDLDGEEEKDRACLESLLAAIISDLCMKQPDINNICERNKQREVHLVIMRLLSEYLLQAREVSNWIIEQVSNACAVSQLILFYKQAELIGQAL